MTDNKIQEQELRNELEHAEKYLGGFLNMDAETKEYLAQEGKTLTNQQWNVLVMRKDGGLTENEANAKWDNDLARAKRRVRNANNAIADYESERDGIYAWS